MKISDLSEWEQKDAIVDKENNVLCPECKKNLAIITEYGMIRKCKSCEHVKNEAPYYSFVDANGFKSR